MMGASWLRTAFSALRKAVEALCSATHAAVAAFGSVVAAELPPILGSKRDKEREVSNERQF